jgi:glycerol-3-phosphate cytidylyltransferase
VIVYTGGTMDLFHAGHVFLLRQCRKLAGPDGRVVVALNTDAFVAAYKGKPPVCSYAEREAVLSSCKYVDEVIRNSHGSDSRPAIEAVRPDIIAIGVDWAGKDYYAQMSFTQQWLDDRGISLVYLPRPAPISSTEVKNRITEYQR